MAGPIQIGTSGPGVGYGFGGIAGGQGYVYVQHFDVQSIPAAVRETTVPGFSGKVFKKLSLQFYRIIETGICGKDAQTQTALFYGKGDPTITQKVTTRLQGSYANCYKVDASARPLQTGAKEPNSTTGGRIQYTIIWEVVSV